jgi:hypothetical protein
LVKERFGWEFWVKIQCFISNNQSKVLFPEPFWITQFFT